MNGEKNVRTRKKTVIKSTLGIGIIVAIVALVMIIRGISTQPDINKNKETIAELENKLDKAKEEQAEADRMAENTDSDEYVEKVARDDLGMVKKDEIVFYDVSEK